MEKDIKFVIYTAGKALISFIPEIGGPITSLINDFQTKEIERCIFDLQNKISRVENKIDKNFIITRDYCLYASNSIEEIIKCRNVIKKRALENIFINATTNAITTLDEAEDYELLIYQLSEKKLGILISLINIRRNESLSETVEMLMENLSIDIETLLDNIKDLENLNLVNGIFEQYTQGGIYTDGEAVYRVENKFYLTTKGINLVKYICEIE